MGGKDPFVKATYVDELVPLLLPCGPVGGKASDEDKPILVLSLGGPPLGKAPDEVKLVPLTNWEVMRRKLAILGGTWEIRNQHSRS